MVVHQPHSQSQRREIACDVCWHDLPAPSIEAPVPLAEHGMCWRGELNARVALATEPLVELMQRHRDEVSKRRVLQLRQLTMRQLVLHVQTMVQAVLGQTAIAQQRASQYRSLFLRERYCRSILNFPRRYPHTSTVPRRADRQVGLSPIQPV